LTTTQNDSTIALLAARRWTVKRMPKVYCAAIDCEFNGDDGKCHAKSIELSDHSIQTLWEGRQRFQRCKTYQKSREAAEMEKFIEAAIKQKEANDGNGTNP
jgi:hypothetical protein